MIADLEKLIGKTVKITTTEKYTYNGRITYIHDSYIKIIDKFNNIARIWCSSISVITENNKGE